MVQSHPAFSLNFVPPDAAVSLWGLILPGAFVFARSRFGLPGAIHVSFRWMR
jgi:hypothetical protein